LLLRCYGFTVVTRLRWFYVTLITVVDWMYPFWLRTLLHTFAVTFVRLPRFTFTFTFVVVTLRWVALLRCTLYVCCLRLLPFTFTICCYVVTFTHVYVCHTFTRLRLHTVYTRVAHTRLRRTVVRLRYHIYAPPFICTRLHHARVHTAHFTFWFTRHVGTHVYVARYGWILPLHTRLRFTFTILRYTLRCLLRLLVVYDFTVYVHVYVAVVYVCCYVRWITVVRYGLRLRLHVTRCTLRLRLHVYAHTHAFGYWLRYVVGYLRLRCVVITVRLLFTLLPLHVTVYVTRLPFYTHTFIYTTRCVYGYLRSHRVTFGWLLFRSVLPHRLHGYTRGYHVHVALGYCGFCGYVYARFAVYAVVTLRLRSVAVWLPRSFTHGLRFTRLVTHYVTTHTFTVTCWFYGWLQHGFCYCSHTVHHCGCAILRTRWLPHSRVLHGCTHRSRVGYVYGYVAHCTHTLRLRLPHVYVYVRFTLYTLHVVTVTCVCSRFTTRCHTVAVYTRLHAHVTQFTVTVPFTPRLRCLVCVISHTFRLRFTTTFTHVYVHTRWLRYVVTLRLRLVLHGLHTHTRLPRIRAFTLRLPHSTFTVYRTPPVPVTPVDFTDLPHTRTFYFTHVTRFARWLFYGCRLHRTCLPTPVGLRLRGLVTVGARCRYVTLYGYRLLHTHTVTFGYGCYVTGLFGYVYVTHAGCLLRFTVYVWLIACTRLICIHVYGCLHVCTTVVTTHVHVGYDFTVPFYFGLVLRLFTLFGYVAFTLRLRFTPVYCIRYCGYHALVAVTAHLVLPRTCGYCARLPFDLGWLRVTHLFYRLLPHLRSVTYTYVTTRSTVGLPHVWFVTRLFTHGYTVLPGYPRSLRSVTRSRLRLVALLLHTRSRGCGYIHTRLRTGYGSHTTVPLPRSGYTPYGYRFPHTFYRAFALHSTFTVGFTVVRSHTLPRLLRYLRLCGFAVHWLPHVYRYGSGCTLRLVLRFALRYAFYHCVCGYVVTRLRLPVAHVTYCTAHFTCRARYTLLHHTFPYPTLHTLLGCTPPTHFTVGLRLHLLVGYRLHTRTFCVWLLGLRTRLHTRFTVLPTRLRTLLLVGYAPATFTHVGCVRYVYVLLPLHVHTHYTG